MTDVTAAVIRRGNHVLIAQRGPGESHAGQWEFPGGKVEDGESPKDCLARELREEFNVDATVNAFLLESIYSYDGGAIRLLAYDVSIPDDTAVQLTVHSAVKWVMPAEILNFSLLPADIPIAEYLKNQ